MKLLQFLSKSIILFWRRELFCNRDLLRIKLFGFYCQSCQNVDYVYLYWYRNLTNTRSSLQSAGYFRAIQFYLNLILCYVSLHIKLQMPDARLLSECQLKHYDEIIQILSLRSQCVYVCVCVCVCAFDYGFNLYLRSRAKCVAFMY